MCNTILKKEQRHNFSSTELLQLNLERIYHANNDWSEFRETRPVVQFSGRFNMTFGTFLMACSTSISIQYRQMSWIKFNFGFTLIIHGFVVLASMVI